MINNVYYRQNGKLTKSKVQDLEKNIGRQLSAIGLPVLRETFNADVKSPVMVVVK